MFTKILVPLDGSDLSALALPKAAELAQQTGASVVVLQVIDSEAQLLAQVTGMTIEPMPIGEITVDAARAAVEAQRSSAKETLTAALATLKAAGVTNATAEIREGQAGDAIVEAADALDADVVVMGSHGRSGLKRLVLGSVAEHVARHAKNSSVMLVKPEGDFVEK